MLQLHLSDQQFYCLLRCASYQRFDGNSAVLCFVLLSVLYHPSNQYLNISIPISTDRSLEADDNNKSKIMFLNKTNYVLTGFRLSIILRWTVVRGWHWFSFFYPPDRRHKQFSIPMMTSLSGVYILNGKLKRVNNDMQKIGSNAQKVG